MTDKQVIDGKTIGCPCYINRPLHRYDKACLVQSQAFTEQQTEEKPILRCDEIKNCPIKENYKQLKRKEQEIKKICKAFDIEYAIDEETGNLFGRCNKLYKKEQECERLKHDNEYEVGALEKTIDNLKAENDLFRTCHDNEQAKRRKYKQTLAEIKEVLQFYNNTTIGTDKGNGIFEFEVFNDNILGGKFICCYDTNPAKKALQKISECEVEDEIQKR